MIKTDAELVKKSTSPKNSRDRKPPYKPHRNLDNPLTFNEQADFVEESRLMNPRAHSIHVLARAAFDVDPDELANAGSE